MKLAFRSAIYRSTRVILHQNVVKQQHSALSSLFLQRSQSRLITNASATCSILSSNEMKNDQFGNLQISNPILNQLQQHIATGNQEKNSFYVVDTHAIEQRYKLWNEYLPHVSPYYAVKCNPDPLIIETLAKLGTGFDCASSAEIDAVLAAGVSANNIIYANPCKQPSHILHAANAFVDTMTFDSMDELDKIKRLNPSSKLVLRLYVDDTKSICRLGTKFGAMLHDTPEILQRAKDLNLNVIGVSFHVGSGCTNSSAYSDAVANARKVFDIGHSLGFNFEVLDIGGGFPGTPTAPVSFEECAKALQTSLSKHFPMKSGIRVISEPGRFFAASSHTLAVNIIGRKTAPSFNAAAKEATKNNPHFMYFVNDGLYASFNCLVYDHASIQPTLIENEETGQLFKDKETFSSSIWGSTCDGMDCIVKDIALPQLNIGEWIYFPSMGAYTSAAGSNFNGFEKAHKVYFDSNEIMEDVKDEQFVH